MPDFTTKIKISKKDFLWLSLYVSFSNKYIKTTTIIGLAFIIFALFQFIVLSENSYLFLPGISLLALSFIIPCKAIALYNKSIELSKEFTLQLSDDYFKLIGHESIDTIPWEKVNKIINLKNSLIIFTGIHSAKLINKKYLSEEDIQFIFDKKNNP